MNTTTTQTAPALWALLIGINDYQSPAVNPLQGCVNDTEALRQFLTEQLAVPKDHIRTLRNQEATRDGILKTFQTFLIDNPAIQHGDQILFHYSGHGSRMKDPTGTEPGGLYETIVPHDSRTADVYDIPDKTLAALLDRLIAAKGDNVTVIMDCCHSGSGTRVIPTPGLALTREIPADDRPPPPDLDAGLLPETTSRQRSVGPSGWLPVAMPYVLLAACRDQEKANEYSTADQDQGAWQGALTYFTVQTLRQLTAPISYAELHERVAAQINTLYASQMPQCEGQRQRQVLGSGLIRRDLFITVREVLGDVVILNAGSIHGLTQDTHLNLYPETVRTRDQLPDQPLASATVTAVSAITADAVIDPPEAVIPVNARALIVKTAPASVRQRVALSGEGPANQSAIERLRQAILEAAPGKQPSPYLEIQSDLSQPADLRVTADQGQLYIHSANGELLVKPEAITGQGEDVTGVLHALEAIARYRSVLDLRNQNPASQLAGNIRVKLRRYVKDPQGARDEELPEDATDAGGNLTLIYHPEHPQTNWYVVEVRNDSAQPIYPHVFCLNPDYSITRIYPNHGQENAVQPGGALKAGLPASGDNPLNVFLPDRPVRWDACRDYLKVIVTTKPTDLSWLIQGGLHAPPPGRDARARGGGNSALDRLLAALKTGSLTRFGGVADTGPVEDWATAELPFAVVRARRSP